MDIDGGDGSQHHQPSSPSWSGVYVPVVISFHLMGSLVSVNYLECTASDMLAMSFRKELKFSVSAIADLLFKLFWFPGLAAILCFLCAHIFLTINP